MKNIPLVEEITKKGFELKSYVDDSVTFYEVTLNNVFIAKTLRYTTALAVIDYENTYLELLVDRRNHDISIS